MCEDHANCVLALPERKGVPNVKSVISKRQGRRFGSLEDTGVVVEDSRVTVVVAVVLAETREQAYSVTGAGCRCLFGTSLSL
jgi:hypothetical protein